MNVDCYTKVFTAKRWSIFCCTTFWRKPAKPTTLANTFNDAVFKILFSLDENEKVRHSSIKEKLSQIPSDYPSLLWVYLQAVQRVFSGLEWKIKSYPCRQYYRLGHFRRMAEGNANRSGKLAVKYTTAFDGILPCEVNLFNEFTYSSEDNVLPKVVVSHRMIGCSSDHYSWLVIRSFYR